MSLKRDHKQMEQRRLRAAKLFDRGYSSSEVAGRLGVVRQVSHRWKQAWAAGGSPALASKGKAGRKSKIDANAGRQITAALLAGPGRQGHRTELWTLPRVRVLIHKLTGVRYHEGHVWRVLGALGFSCQRPERRAVERDEKAIRTWQRKTWPALKKTPRSSAEPSSLLMKAD
jgi:transposase